MIRLPCHTKGQKIGLLGGSFNPAHDGHVYISKEALKRCRLDQVWWLVSPQNPLKPVRDMAPLDQRVTAARAIVTDRRIKVLDVERHFKSAYTSDTLKTLHSISPGVDFFWMMGADNLVQIDNWHNWRQIFQTTAVMVFDRRPYSRQARTAKAARVFKKSQLSVRKLQKRALFSCLPAWGFVSIRPNLLSATEIRRGQF